MSTLITLGNGFDLKAGMQSSYSHFMGWLKNEYKKEYAIICDGISSAFNYGYIGQDSVQKPLDFSTANLWTLLFLCLYAVTEKCPNFGLRHLKDWKDVEKMMFSMTINDGICWAEINRHMDLSFHNRSGGILYYASDLLKNNEPILINELISAILRSNGRTEELMERFARKEPDSNFVSMLLKELHEFENVFGQFIHRQGSDQALMESRQALLNKLTGLNCRFRTFGARFSVKSVQ